MAKCLLRVFQSDCNQGFPMLSEPVKIWFTMADSFLQGREPHLKNKTCKQFKITKSSSQNKPPSCFSLVNTMAVEAEKALKHPKAPKLIQNKLKQCEPTGQKLVRDDFRVLDLDVRPILRHETCTVSR